MKKFLLDERLEEIALKVVECNRLEEQILQDAVREIQYGTIVDFASDLSDRLGIEDNDAGAFDSKFRLDLENLITEALRVYVREQTK